MRDLANERSEVVTRLQQFNFEPVNAEGWMPTGSRPWERILQEIASSNVFLLLVGRFNLARDLCDAVGRSLVELLSEEYQNRIRKRAAEAIAAANAMPANAPEEEPDLPPGLIHQVRSRTAVLFAGAGVSLDAGYPAAPAWGEFLMQRI